MQKLPGITGGANNSDHECIKEYSSTVELTLIFNLPQIL